MLNKNEFRTKRLWLKLNLYRITLLIYTNEVDVKKEKVVDLLSFYLFLSLYICNKIIL